MTTKTQKKNNKQDWEVKKLGEVCNLIKGKKPKTFSKIGKPYLTAKSIRGSEKSKFTEEIEKVVIVSPEDIVIIMDGSNSGEMFQNLNGILASTMGVLNFDKKKIDTRFLLYFLIGYSEEFTKSRTGSAIPHLNKEQFNNLLFPVVSLSEQKRIVKILDGVFADIEEARKNAQKNLDNAKELFESYLEGIFKNDSDEWEEKKLGEVYDVRDGTHDSPTYQNNGHLLITSKNLRGGFNTRNAKFVSKDDFNNINKRSKVDKGDILFAMIGTIGTPTVIEQKPDFAIKNVALFKVSEKEDNYFLKYYLESPFVIDKMQREAKGSTQKFVGLGYLRNFPIKLPPLKTQKQIVKKLDELSEQVKEYETILQNKITDLDELKKSVLQKAFDGEL